jgi:hypothetical protein
MILSLLPDVIYVLSLSIVDFESVSRFSQRNFHNNSNLCQERCRCTVPLNNSVNNILFSSRLHSQWRQLLFVGLQHYIFFCSVLLEHTSLDCKNPETGRINSNYFLIEVGTCSRRHGVCTTSCGPTWFLWVFSRNPCHRNTLTCTKGEMEEGTLAVRW